MLPLLLLITGAYLIDSAVKNRGPLNTLLGIVKNPSAARQTLTASAGSGFVSTGSNTGATTMGQGATAGSSIGEAAVAWARTQIGKPYKFGATGPDSYDCSGLAQQAYKHAGLSIPRTTAQDIFIGTRVSRAQLQIGDLVFPDAGHVQLYSGNGMVVEAPSKGKKVREVQMWGFLTARRPTNSTKAATVQVAGGKLTVGS